MLNHNWYGVPPHLQQLTLATASTGVSSPPSTGPMQPVGVWSLPGQQATSNTGSADSSASHTGQVFSSELNNLDAQTRKLFVSSGFSPFLDVCHIHYFKNLLQQYSHIFFKYTSLS
ncbi:unnamed protein product [Protopolystoma xenopodis]|uniref:Uncharacterized protein n=1 Tax=Protopolystoma xenopodis TaxID=117903 RepID=A0A3S5B8G0_9PLAT|nr:unnamed protein product [Protopolystoma xenopodis]